MKKRNCILTAILSIVIAIVSVNAQGLTIGTGTTFSLGSSTLSLTGNWSNAGTFTAGSGTVIFNGASGNQSITKSSGEAFNNLTINKTAGDVQLANNIAVSGTLTCTSGDLDLNGSVLTLTGTLSETSGNTVKGTTGYITCSSDLNAPFGTNPHNVGIIITSDANLGTTTIIRGHAAQTNSGNSGMLRYFEITPTTNTSLNASIVFNYDDSELNSLDESTFEMFNSTDNGSTWTEFSGALNTTNNTYSVSGLNSLSRYTLASSTAPLPVELISFAANVVDNGVLLNWQTATEVNNYGFSVERSVILSPDLVGAKNLLPQDWQNIGFVEGSGNSNSTKQYSFIDKEVSSGSYSYRLKQIDIDGSHSYSNIVEVACNLQPTTFELYQNYPNPFNPTTTIKYSIPMGVETGQLARHTTGAPSLQYVTLKIYDLLGNEVSTLVNDPKEPGIYEIEFNASQLPSGVYFCRLQNGSGINITRKLLLMK